MVDGIFEKKTRQQNFEIIIERVELLDVDSELVIVEGRLVKYNRTYSELFIAENTITRYNRTCKAISGSLTILKELDCDFDVQMQVFALYSNEYRRTPINYKRNVCDAFKMEYLWIKKQMEKYSSGPTGCPMQAGTYYVKDFIPNGADFPAAANIPWEYRMLDIRFVHKAKLASIFKMYIKLDHDAELKKLA
ncbi:hypothetical protein CBL_10040 [Carabus blaptoides fortunei]